MVNSSVQTKANNLRSQGFFAVYFIGFLFAFHTALPTFINSSFLNVFITERLLNLVYVLASIFTIILFFMIPYILKRFGNYRMAVFLILSEMVALLGLIFSQKPILLVSFFIISLVSISFIYFSLDIFLEGFSKNKETGQIRGTYLTLGNLAWIFSPLIVGLILKNGDYWKIYLAALIFLIPILFILVKGLRNFDDSKYEATSFWQTLKEICRNKNIKNIFITTFLLNFFYSWMTIYTPLYLHKYIGFSWSEIGIIFGIMLIPFVILQFPLGRIADKILGEKEILSFGFVIMSIATAILFFIPEHSSLWLWATILFITRIGASSVEVMGDTYFFKKVNNLNANIISFFRISRPLAYVLGPLVMTLSLSLIGPDRGQLFLILGLIMLFGLWFSLGLKDTK